MSAGVTRYGGQLTGTLAAFEKLTWVETEERLELWF